MNLADYGHHQIPKEIKCWLSFQIINFWTWKYLMTDSKGKIETIFNYSNKEN